MAKIFVGDRTRVDTDVLRAIETLPDEFWVFAEFNVSGRQIDWFIARATGPGASTDAHSTLIVMELKRTSRMLEGSVDARWRTQGDGASWQEVATSNEADLNYYWQAVNAANSLNLWLWNNQQLYMNASETFPQGEFKLWPDLLILSPPGVTHRLPLQPPSRYGQWWTNLDTWLNHIAEWKPRRGVALTAQQLASLVELLGLQALHSEAVRRADPPQAIGNFVTWLAELEQRVRVLEEELRPGSPS